MQFLEAPPEQLKQRTYNVTGMSFTPEEIFKEIKKFYPDLEVSYHPDSRQDIGKGKGEERRWRSEGKGDGREGLEGRKERERRGKKVERDGERREGRGRREGMERGGRGRGGRGGKGWGEEGRRRRMRIGMDRTDGLRYRVDSRYGQLLGWTVSMLSWGKCRKSYVIRVSVELCGQHAALSVGIVSNELFTGCKHDLFLL